MRWPSLRSLLERNADFRPLLQDPRFDVIREEYRPDLSGYEIVVLESSPCRVMIEQELGSILVALGPTWASATPDPHQHDVWFDYTTVIAYLAGGLDVAEELPWTGDWATYMDAKLTRIAGTLQPFWQEACALFGQEAFAGTQQQLIAVGKRLAQQRYGPGTFVPPRCAPWTDGEHRDDVA